MSIDYATGNESLLDEAGPLWEALNRHHAERAAHFRHVFSGNRFADRKKGLIEKGASGALRVCLARDSATGEAVGYCIASVTGGGLGEVESLYVADTWRKRGIGSALMRDALDWMAGEGARDRRVGVAVGNEDAWPFYARFGFFPRVTILAARSE